MRTQAVIKTWARGASFALILGIVVSRACAQGTITFVSPAQPMYYGPVDGSHAFDLDGDGVTDFVLSFDIGGARFAPQGSNGVIADGGYFVAAINRGEMVGPSLTPVYQWADANGAPGGFAVLGGQAVFDGMYFYSGNFSGLDAFIGLRFQYGGNTHYGWMEVNNYQDIAAGQVLGWGFETRPDMPILAGAVPEPSVWVLLAAGGFAFCLFRRR